jgi:hypothetical protein
VETKLDKDFNPIWFCEVAGLLFLALLLVPFVVWVAVHGGRNLAEWAMIAWCSFLLFAFWLRYQSGKVTSLLWEFHYGMA